MSDNKSFNRKTIKLCFAASSGGHYEQLMMLKPLMLKYNSFIVTEKTSYISKIDVKCYYMYQINRKELLFIPKILINSFLSLRIIIKEKPDVVICTGVLAMIPICVLAKFLGKKLMYIESFAKVTSATISAKFLYRYADRFYVQWEEMMSIFPDAVYKGSIY